MRKMREGEKDMNKEEDNNDGEEEDVDQRRRYWIAKAKEGVRKFTQPKKKVLPPHESCHRSASGMTPRAL